MKLGTICYAPPPGVLNSDSFVANLLQFPAEHPLFLLSDSTERNPSRLIQSPETIGRRPQWAINNLIFFRALELARDIGLEYFFFIESDSRVGVQGFDDRIFEEFFIRYPDGVASAGSIVCWDLNSGGKTFALRVIEEARDYQRAGGLPASFYSGRHPHDCGGSAYYPNGSCAVYQTQALLKIFAGFDADIMTYSKRITAFDLALGRFLWNYHGPAAVAHVGWLVSCYSAFGNCITTEKERLEMLSTGSKVCVHQIKGV